MASRGIVDADGHVTESTEQLAAYIDPAWRDYASDFPHWDHEFPENIATLRERRDLDDATKAAVLGETARRLYRLDG